MPIADDASYASIDPLALKGVTDSLQKTVDGVNEYLGRLKAGFGQNGIDTTHLDTLGSVSAKISPLIPELRKRQSLAEQLVAESPAGGKIAYFEGDLLGGPFNTVAAAVAQAHIDASTVQDAQKHGKAVPDSVYQDLQKYSSDPDYAAGLVNDLGPKGSAYLISQAVVDDPSDHSNGADWKKQAVGNLFATASYRVNIDSNYLVAMQKALRNIGVGTESSVKLMTEIMPYGTWDEGTLSRMADIVLNPEATDGLDADRDADMYSATFTALDNNPIAAADYFAKNHSALYADGKGDGRFGPGGYFQQADGAYAAFVNMATVGSRGEYAELAANDPSKQNVTEQNAQWLVGQVGNSKSGDWTHDMDMTFANIANEYIGDIGWSIGSPTDAGAVNMPGRDGIEVSQSGWANFLKVPMTDNSAAAQIAATFVTWVGQAQTQSTTDQSTNPTYANANFLDNYTIGRMESLFTYDYQQACNVNASNLKARQDAIANLIGTAVDTVADPQGTAKSIVVGLAKTLLTNAATSLDGKNPQPLQLSRLSAGNSWGPNAQSTYNGGKVPPYTVSGVTYTGSPLTYQQEYGGTFTKDGKVEDYSEFSTDPKAVAAYNAWLQDPAIQIAVAPRFSAQLSGAGAQWAN